MGLQSLCDQHRGDRTTRGTGVTGAESAIEGSGARRPQREKSHDTWGAHTPVPLCNSTVSWRLSVAVVPKRTQRRLHRQVWSLAA